VDGSGGAGPSYVTLKDSVLSANSNTGIAVASTGAAFNVMVANTRINLTANVGAAVAGASATLRIAGSTITQNFTGVANFGGTLQSFKNNRIFRQPDRRHADPGFCRPGRNGAAVSAGGVGKPRLRPSASRAVCDPFAATSMT
jgi:hypothetical protein